jgi:TolA-binding protein
MQHNTEMVNAVIAIILLMLMCFNITLYNSNCYLKTSMADSTSRYEDTINEYINENLELSASLTQLQDSYDALQNENTDLQHDVQVLDTVINNLTTQLEENKAVFDVETNKRDFKSYMPYTVITDRSSPQWPLQQQAYTNEAGIRCIDGIPMIAIGTGWGAWVGDKVLVVCENGNRFIAIVGDIKSNAHTDKNNQTTSDNGCRCEFIVDLSILDDKTRVLGNIAATMPEYAGYVVCIIKVK